MGRKFSYKDIEIFKKLAPELEGNVTSPRGHQYLFILRPVSHKVATSSDDFRQRLQRLTAAELEYLADLALGAQEDIRGLAEDDMYAFLDVIAEKIPKKATRLKEFLGILA